MNTAKFNITECKAVPSPGERLIYLYRSSEKRYWNTENIAFIRYRRCGSVVHRERLLLLQKQTKTFSII